jgi:hypothetical protein
VQRFVLVGREAVVGATFIALELVVEPQFFAEPDNALDCEIPR